MVRQVNAAARCSLGTVLGPFAESAHGLFLIKNQNYFHHQPASRLRVHIIMKVAKEHCKEECQTRYSQILANTSAYIHMIHSYLAIFISSLYLYRRIHAHIFAYTTYMYTCIRLYRNLALSLTNDGMGTHSIFADHHSIAAQKLWHGRAVYTSITLGDLIHFAPVDGAILSSTVSCVDHLCIVSGCTAFRQMDCC